MDDRPLGFPSFVPLSHFHILSSSVERLRPSVTFNDPHSPYDSLHPIDFLYSTFISAGLFIIMFTKLFVPVLLVVSPAVTSVFSLPAPASNVFARDDHEDKNSTQGNGNNSTTVQKVMHLNDTAARFPDLGYLAEGNQYFRSAVQNSSNPDLLKGLAENGQHPEYLFLGCRFVK